MYCFPDQEWFILFSWSRKPSRGFCFLIMHPSPGYQINMPSNMDQEKIINLTILWHECFNYYFKHLLKGQYILNRCCTLNIKLYKKCHILKNITVYNIRWSPIYNTNKWDDELGVIFDTLSSAWDEAFIIITVLSPKPSSKLVRWF